MNQESLVVHPVLHSARFVGQWKGLLHALYGYEEAGGGMRVPSVLGGSTMVYLPLLNYTDQTLPLIHEQRAVWSGGAGQWRGLDPDYHDFQPNDTVTMRLSLAGLSAEEVFKQRVHSKCRNQIRKAQKGGLTWVEGVDRSLVSDFYQVFASTMHRYGTPVFSRRLFELLPQHVDARYLVAYHQQTPVAALCLVNDGSLAWVPWAGSEHAYRSLCPNHLLYWNAIEQTIQAGQAVFDFGRSAYLGATYVFKRDWGAQPVKIAILTNTPQQDVYGKYALASRVWQHLPRWCVDRMGPLVCRRLPDL